MAQLVRLTLLLCVALWAADAQDLVGRREWLARNATPIRTLDIGDDDFRDLEPIGKAIGRRRIVLLGEQSHGDGATFRAKARLIRYLHQKRGFDLIVFESGFYDCRRTWSDVRAGMAMADSASGCMFELWWNSAEVQPLLTYIDAEKSRRAPLAVAGMDFQPSGTRARFLLDDFERFARAQKDTTGLDADLATLRATIGAPPAQVKAMTDSSRAEMRGAVARRASRPLRDVASLGSLGQAAFWRQALANASAFVDFLHPLVNGVQTPEVLNQRDSVMADNLVWIARQDPRRKIIVWGASSHLVRNRTGIENDVAPKMVPAGHLVSAMLPDEVYSIAFLAAEGEIGMARRGTTVPRSALPMPDSNSIDGLWRDSGQTLGFLDLRRLGPTGAWLHELLVARPLGYEPMKTDWPRHFDAFVFTRTMSPSTPLRSK